MRRLAACLIVSLALAAPAGAQQGRIASGQPATDAALRGSQSTPPPAAPEDTSFLPPPPAQATATGAGAPSTGAQCRLGCSRQYYFCLAGEDDHCPQNWSRCVSGCGG